MINLLADGLIERSSAMLDQQYQKPDTKTKTAISRLKRSQKQNEAMPFENTIN